MPTLVKHGTLVSLREKPKLFTAKEHLFIMGEAVHPLAETGDYKFYFADVLDDKSLTPAVIKRISGNAMHAISMGCFMLYCMSRLEGLHVQNDASGAA